MTVLRNAQKLEQVCVTRQSNRSSRLKIISLTGALESRAHLVIETSPRRYK